MRHAWAIVGLMLLLLQLVMSHKCEAGRSSCTLRTKVKLMDIGTDFFLQWASRFAPTAMPRTRRCSSSICRCWRRARTTLTLARRASAWSAPSARTHSRPSSRSEYRFRDIYIELWSNPSDPTDAATRKSPATTSSATQASSPPAASSAPRQSVSQSTACVSYINPIPILINQVINPQLDNHNCA